MRIVHRNSVITALILHSIVPGYTWQTTIVNDSYYAVYYVAKFSPSIQDDSQIIGSQFTNNIILIYRSVRNFPKKSLDLGLFAFLFSRMATCLLVFV